MEAFGSSVRPPGWYIVLVKLQHSTGATVVAFNSSDPADYRQCTIILGHWKQ